MSNSDGKKEKECKGNISRRGFMTVMGAAAAGVAASSKLFAQTPAKKEGSVINAEEKTRIELMINGRRYELLAEPRWTLLYVLREEIGLTGAKHGCGRGECGACTVLINDIPRYACMTLAVEAVGTRIETLEGLMDGESLGPVQQAFADEDAYQCGYCTPGQIMSVEGMLRKNPEPSLSEIQVGVSGNLCRCGAYAHIFNAAKTASRLKGKE